MFTDQIPLWFLVGGLFFPRLVLFCSYFFGHCIPANDVPLFGDIVGAICVPRFLIAFYLYEHGEAGTFIFFLYLLFGAFELFTGSSKVRSSD